MKLNESSSAKKVTSILDHHAFSLPSPIFEALYSFIILRPSFLRIGSEGVLGNLLKILTLVEIFLFLPFFLEYCVQYRFVLWVVVIVQSSIVLLNRSAIFFRRSLNEFLQLPILLLKSIKHLLYRLF